MPTYTELDPDVCWAAIEGQEDILTSEAMKLDTFYRHHRCPRCSSELQKEFDSRHAFSDPDTIVPRALLRCPICRYLTDPHNNVVLEYGNAANFEGTVPIIGGK